MTKLLISAALRHSLTLMISIAAKLKKAFSGNILILTFGKIAQILRLIAKAIHTNSRIESIYVHPFAVAGFDLHIRRGTAVDSVSTIKSYTYIGKNVDITNAEVGRYCSIGDNVVIGPGNHDTSQISSSALFYQNINSFLRSKSTIIESDVWIGVNAVIMQGVTVGLGAVVGASAVVTKDVPPFAIVVGVPAKIIRYRFSPDLAKSVLTSKWWLYKPEVAFKIHQALNLSAI